MAKCNYDCFHCPYPDCIESDETTRQIYYREHRDEILAKAKDYYQEHREEIIARSTAYYYAHRDEILAKAKAKNRKCP